MKIQGPVRRAALIIALGVGLALVACGGDPNHARSLPAAEEAVPASAGSTSRAFVALAGSLPTDDRAKPQELDHLVVTSSETELPEPVR